ncbi:MAG: bifunctional ADP-dependent NAD(P)H-hydrate dehydratase/NAD(P)H-hydrate epimerase [Chlamydiae bacterium]|nr:MAG: bifunctional ADP-dependent NAD(P)H-hydrate dehydratase/NAD(P)H-hydrate epimerase [Chlamydiota bacterium]
MGLDGIKVVTAQEMKDLESRAFQKGYSELEFMQQAGISVAVEVEKFIQERKLPKKVLIFAGRGNNAGDGFAAGAILVAKGYSVIAYPIYPLERFGTLCRNMYENFCSQGGKVEFSLEKIQERVNQGLILDALVGTGMKKSADNELASAIEIANHSKFPILAIDIPSGLNGTTGEVGSVAIHATKTIYLEFAKTGFFLRDGWDHVGEIVRGGFGLPEDKVQASACLLNLSSLKLPPIQRSWHKYQKGYVVAIAGSEEMPGAAVLASSAALRSGAGIVHVFCPDKITVPCEIIRQFLDDKNFDGLDQEIARANAILVGPGLGRVKKTDKIVQHLLKINKPLVIDADALFSLAKHPSWKLPSSCILTPHKQEMKRLLGLETKEEIDWLSLCQNYVEEKPVTLVLKGAPTFIFMSGHLPVIIPQGGPALATAGSGDVLTGVITALLCHRLTPRYAAALGCFIHAIAGKKAAENLTSYSVIASDLLHYLPKALSSIEYVT